MLALIVIDIAERKAADELRLVTSLEIFVLEMIQEILPIDIPHIDHVDIDRTQRIARILQIAPRISPSHAGKGTPIIRAILEIDAEFEPGPGHLDRLPPLGSERQQETGKLQTHIDSEFDGVALAGTRSFHILVPYRERNVERLRSPENIAVLIPHRRPQSVETRRRTSFQLYLIPLLQGRNALDVALEIALAGLMYRIGRLLAFAHESHVVILCHTVGLLVENDVGAFEIAHRHNLVVRLIDPVNVIDVVRIDRHDLSQHRRTYVGTLVVLVVHHVQPPVVDRVESLAVVGSNSRRRIVIGKNIDLVDTVNRIVAQNRITLLVITGQMLLDDHLQVHQMIAAERVGFILDVIDRKIVIAALFEVGGDALPLLVKDLHVEHLARTEQRMYRIGQDDLLEEPIAEIVRKAVDAVRLALYGAVGDESPLFPRRGIDFVSRLRREEPPIVHVNLQVADRLLREAHIQQHGRFADTPFEPVPPIILFGIGLLINPDVKIESQEPFIRILTDEFPQVGSRNTLFFRRFLIGFYGHLLHQITFLGKFARDTARHPREHRQQKDEYDRQPFQDFR